MMINIYDAIDCIEELSNDEPDKPITMMGLLEVFKKIRDFDGDRLKQEEHEKMIEENDLMLLERLSRKGRF